MTRFIVAYNALTVAVLKQAVITLYGLEAEGASGFISKFYRQVGVYDAVLEQYSPDSL